MYQVQVREIRSGIVKGGWEFVEFVPDVNEGQIEIDSIKGLSMYKNHEFRIVPNS